MTRIKYVLLLLILTTTLFANGGSVYTRYGMGDLILLTSARNLGLGSIGFASSNGNFINTLNPASWNSMPLTRFELGMYYSGKKITDSNASAQYSDVKFSGFVIGFPVERDLGITVVGGLIPYSHRNSFIIAMSGKHTFGIIGKRFQRKSNTNYYASYNPLGIYRI